MLISSLSEENIKEISRMINEAITAGKSRFEIVFSGGTSILVGDIESLILTEKAIIFDDGRNIDVKNIYEILADGETIVIFK